MSYLRILRPLNCLFVFVTVLCGAFIQAYTYKVFPVIFSAISAMLIAGAGYVINDYFDYPIDKINKPFRVLPSKKISLKRAYFYAVALFVLGIVFSFFTYRIECVIIAIINTFVLFTYAKKYKFTPLIGNLLVSYAAASTFVYGGLSNHNLKNSLIIAFFAFLYTLIRELVKDCEDIAGDNKFNARTLAIEIGKKKTILISIIPGLFIFAFNYYLFLSGNFSKITFIFMNLLVIVPLIYFIVTLLKNIKKKNLSRISKLIKIDMLILLIILWFGK